MASGWPARSQYALLGALAVIVAIGAFSDSYNPYYLDIAVSCGINITLAVSLNLINGLAGQFSIGHAGFMAVGGYTATYLTVYHGRQIARLVGSSVTDPIGASVEISAELRTTPTTAPPSAATCPAGAVVSGRVVRPPSSASSRRPSYATYARRYARSASDRTALLRGYRL